jgi:hypothetical protein
VYREVFGGDRWLLSISKRDKSPEKEVARNKIFLY